MGYVKPEGMRSTIRQEGSGLSIEIPVRRNWFILLFLTFWILGWAAGEVGAGTSLLAGGDEKQPQAFLLVWLAMWTVGGAFAIFVWLWQIAGKELIRVSSGALTTRRALLGFGFTREFGLSHMKNLQVAPPPMNLFAFRSAAQFWGIGGGLIAFDYGSKTYRFGQGVEEAEARDIVARIKQHVIIPDSE